MDPEAKHPRDLARDCHDYQTDRTRGREPRGIHERSGKPRHLIRKYRRLSARKRGQQSGEREPQREADVRKFHG